MKIVIIAEGKTERVFLPVVRAFVAGRLAGKPLPKLVPNIYNGRVPTGEKLKRIVESEIRTGADAVIALTDVYTGTREFAKAVDAKAKMTDWVGANGKFHPHAAQHDFEAWLLPYWHKIVQLAKHNAKCPKPQHPEQVNHGKPPAHHLKELFEAGRCRDSYCKPRDAKRILDGEDLCVAATLCPELKGFLNTILGLCGGVLIP